MESHQIQTCIAPTDGQPQLHGAAAKRAGDRIITKSVDAAAVAGRSANAYTKWTGTHRLIKELPSAVQHLKV